MMFTQPNVYFMSSGSAEGFSPLNAFDQSLLRAGVGDTNLVRMSSILPPGCVPVERFTLPGGSLVPVAYAEMVSSTPGELISAAVAIALPEDPQLPGLIMEHHGAAPLSQIEETVRQMAREGMAFRERAVREVISCGVEHRVVTHGSAFACVVLWHQAQEQTR